MSDFDELLTAALAGKCVRCRIRLGREVYTIEASGSYLDRQEWFICGPCYDDLFDFMWKSGPLAIRRKRKRTVAARRRSTGQELHP